MKIFILKKPKKTILNILHIFSLLMMLISVVVIITVYLYREYPQYINMIDKSIPSFYGYKIESIYKKAKESPTELEKYNNYTLLYNELDGHITLLGRHYQYYVEAVKYKTEYLIKNNQLQKALELSEKYESEYPYDFFAKFQYSKVLGLADKNKAKKYIEQLYKKHRDITKVQDVLLSFYSENGLINEAIELENENSIWKFNIAFTAYFIDKDEDNFNPKQKLLLFSENIETKGGANYFITFQHDFKKFKGLRLDLDGLNDMQKFEVRSMSLGSKEQEYQDIKIKSLNHVIKNGDNSFVISGHDPYLVLSLPDDLRDYTGVVDLSASIAVHKPLSIINKLSKNKEWQFFYSESQGFRESQSEKFEFSLESDNVLKADLRFDHPEKIKFVRLDLPSYDGLKIKNINILMNDSTKLSKSEVNQMHSIIKTDEGYVVKGHDPYLIYKLGKKETINKISVRIDL